MALIIIVCVVAWGICHFKKVESLDTIDDNKLYYVGEGRIDIDNGNIKTGNKTYIEKRYYKVNKRMNFVRKERTNGFK